MGGLGSGRRYREEEVKPVVEEYPEIVLNKLNRQKLLFSGNTFKIEFDSNEFDITSVSVLVEEESLFFLWQQGSTQKTQRINLSRLPCNYGGHRSFFLCPDCSKKRNAVYLGKPGKWACRECLGLGYRVQKLNPHKRHRYVAEKLKQKKLTLSDNTGLPPFEKPYGMWNRTYEKTVSRIQEHELTSIKHFQNWFEGIKRLYY